MFSFIATLVCALSLALGLSVEADAFSQGGASTRLSQPTSPADDSS